MEEEEKREVFFETRHHASGPHCSNYPPTIRNQHQEQREGSKGSYLSRLLSFRGIAQIKEKWSTYKLPKRSRKFASLFVSPGGDLVAVATGNRITILKKEDDYQEPRGIFTCENNTTILFGAWAETHDSLGVVDDADTLYLIRGNGEEITRFPKRLLKASSQIVGLVVQDDINVKTSCLCTFLVFTSDGSFHEVEISQDPGASVFSRSSSTSDLIHKHHLPQHIVCLDYHPKLSLLSLVNYAGSMQSASSGSGLYNVSLWQRSSNLNFKLMGSAQFEGSIFTPKGNVDQIALPKVRISAQGKFVAVLDVKGHLVAFKFDNELHSLSFTTGEGHNSDLINSRLSPVNKHFDEIVDFAWWSDNIITLAERSRMITMFDMYAGVNLLRTDIKYSLPLLERPQNLSGKLFLLESKSPTGSYSASHEIGARNVNHIEWDTVDADSQSNWAKMEWNLVSFSERSVLEMYTVLIAQHEYEAALRFADNHCLDKDEALKSQWLHSSHGRNAIKTSLATIKDKKFVLNECVDRFGPTEDAVRDLLDHGFLLTDSYRFSNSEGIEQNEIWDFRLTRLRLLQLKDKLETFLGINMGRFSMQEYKKFCNLPIKEAAIGLAESGKIGALNLIFKRHPYSLTACMLDVLSAVPETIPVHTYVHLLPGESPPNIALREDDWVECLEMVSFVSKTPENHESRTQIRTESIVKQSVGYHWPSLTELSSWYKNRAKDIDTFSGQLDNCISLIELACWKGIHHLKPFLEEILYLRELVYCNKDDDTMNYSMSLSTWENLPNYERFKLMLVGVNEENVIRRLQNIAIPFMKKKCHFMTVVPEDVEQPSTLVNSAESFLVRWLKEIASENKLEICSIVIDEGCRGVHNNCFFSDEVELVDCALHCIYLCSVTDRWSIMASILSKLPNIREFGDAHLKERFRLSEGHIEAGRLLVYYQVPKPISFFLEAGSDGKGIKQILRLILSKFIRRQPVQTDSEWANMWRDLQYLQEKAFPFIDLEYVLMEFCRGLLKAEKFLLARSYLRGAGSVSLATDKAENLVIQAAREYFYSASSLACSEIWKAKECLNILPNNRSVIAEADIIDCVTVKLPNLGVTLLPMQFKQIKDPMEIIKLAITSQTGAYLNVDEIIEISKLLGLSSQDDISAVQEAIAREAAVVGDLQLAFELCLILAKKGHGPVWDLCVALARGPVLNNMDISSRKHLLGFALSHCDGESIGELLHGWKDLDIQMQCDSLIIMTGKEPQPISVQDSSYHQLHGVKKVGDITFFDQETQLNRIKGFLSQVAKELHIEGDACFETILRDNGKILSFAAMQLPWLIELIHEAGNGKKLMPNSVSRKQYISVRTKTIIAILSWLAWNGFAPKDDLVASLAKSIMEPPVSEEEDIIGCSYLLNLVDAYYGVGIIEENLKSREIYSEKTSIMNVGMIYGLLNNSGATGAMSEEPAQRRELIIRSFQQNKSVTSDERDRIDKAQSTFWKEWKMKLEDQKRLADHSRVLEQMIPGVEVERFLLGDLDYIESSILSIINSVKREKKYILKDVSSLALTYGLDRCKLILQCLKSMFISEAWSVHDLVTEVSEFKGELHGCAKETIKYFSLFIYPSLNEYDKDHLTFMYSILSDCSSSLAEQNEPMPIMDQGPMSRTSTWYAHFYKVAAEECNRVSSILSLNFKNIAGLQGLKLESFNSEVCAHINENNVDLLAKMVQNLIESCEDTVQDDIISWHGVYARYILDLLIALETRGSTEMAHFESFLNFLSQLEQTYDLCRKYLKFISRPLVTEITRRFLTAVVPAVKTLKPGWKVSLVMFVDIWLRILDDLCALPAASSEVFVSEISVVCLRAFRNLIEQEKISPNQGWAAVLYLLSYGHVSESSREVFNIFRAMIFAGCGFESISGVFVEATICERTRDLQDLYIIILNAILQDLDSQALEEYQCLHHLLSSLSRLEGEIETLQTIRRAVWERMAEFSDNLKIPSHARVHILELMHFISASSSSSSRHNNMKKGVSSEFQTNLLPWEGWVNFQQGATTSSQKTVDDEIPNTLAALKSTRLASTISPALEVKPEDLLTLDSAVSCFFKISSHVVSEPHVDTLLDILREWEGLFSCGNVDSVNTSDGGNDWENDDWGDDDGGWESFPEDKTQLGTKKDETFSIHPFHVCWLEIFKKLLTMSRYKDLLRLIDQSNAQTNEVFLDEEGARSLTQIALEIDCLLSLKLMLMFPYKQMQLQCLDAVEQNLKNKGISDDISRDHDFLILVLSSGLISTIVSDSSYGSVFSYLCYMVGDLLRLCHYCGSVECYGIMDSLVFTEVVFPCFISELIKADQQILAGLLVTKLMHTNASVSLINIAEASLRKYLETRVRVLPETESSLDNHDGSEFLTCSLSNLRGKMGSLVHSALSSLSFRGR
ncbi:hypothetical protein DM860_010988 [Cuscuta australis]|uniref:Sec39 domain-containing protein n=1 Tax=Cuscuta australis TaxID=267555 RepID=A0A328E232_9ASTE|nr:hypothetical protein DM860_010988 [Cuscuta australis]